MRSVAYRAAVALVAVLAAVGALLVAEPARAADVYIQVTPSSVPAGDMIGIRASCRSNWHPATVESEAFGTVTVQPQHGFLTATVTIPRQTRSGTYRVKLHCPEGPGASTRLTVTGGGPQPRPYPSRGPATGFGGGRGGLEPEDLLLPGGLGIALAGLALATATTQWRRPRSVRRPTRR